MHPIQSSTIWQLRSLALTLLMLLPLQVYANSEWSWTTEPTPGASNTILNEEGEEQENYSDGDLSENILLSELMPNPEGTDTDFEWIEIYNSGTQNVNLGNWSLDDEEEGSTPYVFPEGTTIEAKDFLVVYRSESDISLNNDTDQVRLFDYQGTIRDEVTYETSPEGQSYARIGLEELALQTNFSKAMAWFIPQAKAAEATISIGLETPWQWTNEVTIGSSNPLYYRIQGKILEVLAFENKIKLDEKGKPIEISLAKLNLNETLKASIFQPGNMISGYAALNGEKIYELIKLEESETSGGSSEKSKTHTKTKILIALSSLIGGAGLMIHKKIKPRIVAA